MLLPQPGTGIMIKSVIQLKGSVGLCADNAVLQNVYRWWQTKLTITEGSGSWLYSVFSWKYMMRDSSVLFAFQKHIVFLSLLVLPQKIILNCHFPM